MNEKNTELSNGWLKKANNDIVTARQTLLLEDGPTDTVSFHAQQAIEKSLKAFLTSIKVEFPKIHDLSRLMEMVIPYLHELEEFRESFIEIAEYAVEVRYPQDTVEPSHEEAQKSLEIAEKIYNLLRTKIEKKQ